MDLDINVSMIINKLREYAGYSSDKELAIGLGLSPSTISSWRKRNSIDLKIIFNKFPTIDLNWLLKEDDTNTIDILKENIELKDEIKKMDTKINIAQDEYSNTVKSIPNEAIEEVSKWRQRYFDALDIINTLRAK